MSVIRQGSRPVAQQSLGKAAVVVGIDVFRIEFDSTIVVGDSSIHIALAFLGKAAVSVGFGVFGIEFDGTITICNGTVVVALVIFGETPIVVRVRVLWIKFEGAVVVDDGSVQIALGVLGLGAVEEIFTRTLHPIGSICPCSVNKFRRMLMFLDLLLFQGNFVSGHPA